MPSRPFDRTAAHRLDRRSLVASAVMSPILTAVPFSQTVRAQQGHGFGFNSRPSGNDALRAFLAMLPVELFEKHKDTGPAWMFADVATQLASLGIEMPADGLFIPDGFLNAQSALAVDSGVYSCALVEDFVEALGFAPLSVHTTLTAGAPPAQISMFRGGFDTSGLPAAWEAVDYVASDGPDGMQIWTLGEPGDLDLNHPIQGRTISGLNNFAIAGDTGIASGSKEVLLEILDVIAGNAPSLAEHDLTLAALDGMPGNLVSAVGLNSAFLEVRDEDPTELLAESDKAVGPMPPLTSMTIGVTPGLTVVDPEAATSVATPDASRGEGLIHAQMVTESPVDAAQAATVSEYRWTTGRSLLTQEPLAELLPLQSATADGNTAHLVFANPRTPRVWFWMILSRDVYPYLWESPDIS